MPSFLGEYEGGAKGREMKFIRSINSFHENTYQKKDLVIISDGCEITNALYLRHGNKWNNVHLLEISKKKMFSGEVREAGLRFCNSDYVCYLDSDDIIGNKHLEVIVQLMSHNNYDFCYFNDYIKKNRESSPNKNNLQTRITKLEYGKCGTSTIAHKPVFSNGYVPTWDNCNDYGHDFKFIMQLQNKTQNYGKINGCSYIVCHLKGTEIDY